MDVDDEDPVVRELDVFLTKRLSSELRLQQCPLRPRTFPYDISTMRAVDFKPVAQRLRLRFQVTQDCLAYDKSSEWAAETMRDVTTTPILADGEFAVGIVTAPTSDCGRAELHLTPIAAIDALRPAFDHVDDAHERAREISTTLAYGSARPEGLRLGFGRAGAGGGEPGGGAAGATTDDDFDDLAVVKPELQRRDVERSFYYRRHSSHRYRQMELEEAWMPCRFAAIGSVPTRRRWELLLCSRPLVDIDWDGDAQSYLAGATDGERGHAGDLARGSSQPAPGMEGGSGEGALEKLRSLPVDRQVEALMINAHLLPFRRAVEILCPVLPVERVLADMQSCARLVQGCWVLKSDFASENALRVLYRDLLLSHFAENAFLSRAAIAEKNIPMDAATGILKEISRQVRDSGWRFLVDAGTTFEREFPLVASEQKAWWLRRGKDVTAILATRDTVKSPRGAAPYHAVSARWTAPASSVADASQLPAGSELDAAVVEKLPALPTKPLEPFVGQTVEDQLDFLLKAELDREGLCSFRALQLKVVEQQQEMRPNNLLANGVSEELLKSRIDLLCVQTREMYCLRSTGDKTVDEARHVVARLFSTKNGLRKQDLKEAVKEQLDRDIGTLGYQKIMREFANVKQGRWFLKQG